MIKIFKKYYNNLKIYKKVLTNKMMITQEKRIIMKILENQTIILIIILLITQIIRIIQLKNWANIKIIVLIDNLAIVQDNYNIPINLTKSIIIIHQNLINIYHLQIKKKFLL